MKLQSFFSILAIAAGAAGGILLIVTAPILGSLGWLTVPVAGASDPLAMTTWWAFSFVRVAAMLLMGAGLCLWTVRHELSEDAARRLAVALGGTAFGLAGMVITQTEAIWAFTIRWGLFAILMLTGLVLARMTRVTARPA